MSDVTRILSQIEQGNSAAADQLLPLVYNELRKLAAAKLAQENPGQTLQATALVHEAYVRLVDDVVVYTSNQTWQFRNDQVALRRMQVAAGWIAPQRPARLLVLLPGGKSE